MIKFYSPHLYGTDEIIKISHKDKETGTKVIFEYQVKATNFDAFKTINEYDVILISITEQRF